MEGYIGDIKIFAGNFPPRYWAFCDGSVLPINQYAALFAIIGTTYGGNGQSTFALPNLTSPAASGNYGRYIICLSGIFPARP